MILITEFMGLEAVERMKKAATTVYAPDLVENQDAIGDHLDGVQALIVRNRTQVTAALLDSGPDLRVVGRLGVGLDNIDLEACAARNVEVIPALGANTLSVAEYVVTNALVLLRGAYLSRASMQAGEWPRQSLSGREVHSKIMGLLGYGAIAQETARLARGLGMEIIAFDPYLPDDNPAWQTTERMELPELLAKADVVSLHVPLIDSTRHMINKDTLRSMKPDAVLINAARGGVVDENALATALKNGTIAGAALDVFENEPLTAASAEIFAECENLILTPHIAGVTVESNLRVSTMIAEAVLERLET